VAVAEAVAVRDEVLADVLLDELQRRRSPKGEPVLDRLLARGEGARGALSLRKVEPDVGEQLDRRIEERRTLDAARVEIRQLEDEAGAAPKTAEKKARAPPAPPTLAPAGPPPGESPPPVPPTTDRPPARRGARPATS